MNVLSALHTLLGQHQAPQTHNNGLVEGHQPMPGYHNQAVQYAQAMQRGDYNNPMVVGPHAIDPKYFGYPADTTARLQMPLHQLIHGQLTQQHGMASNFATPVQGTQNPGFTPVQASRGVFPVQGGMSRLPFNVQSNNANPQQGNIFY